MRILIIVIVAVVFGLSDLRATLFAQSSGFHMEIEGTEDLSIGDAMELNNDTFFAIIRFVPPFGTPDQALNKAVWFNRDGIIDSSVIPISSSRLGQVVPLQGKSEFIIAGTRTVDSQSQSVLLLRVTDKFVPLDTSEVFPFNGLNGLYRIKIHNNQFLICGATYGLPGYSARSFVGILNNDLDADTITGYKSNKLFSTAYDITSFKDRFIHTGLGYVPNSAVGDQIIVTDTFFNIDTIHILPYRYEATFVKYTGSDSTFYIGGRLPPRKASKAYRDLYIAKWHLRKGLMDTVVFGSYDSSNIQVFPGISSVSNYIYFGGTVNYDIPPEYGQQQSKYLVAKFDTNLNLIWQRSFEVENSYLYLSKILATSDGGCLLAGNKFDYVEHPTLPKRSVYIIKLDSNGNIVTGIDETPKEPLSLSVYPNPASDFIRIEAPGHEEVLIELFTSTGQMVRKTRFLGQTQLSVKHLPSGIYLYRFELQDGETGYGKIVVQH